MKYKVIVEAEISDAPKNHEFAAATIMARHFKADVIFLRPTRYKTPDFKIKDHVWELKSPMGGSARTIENNMRSARSQSKNIIIDLVRIKLHQNRAIAHTNYFLSKPNQFRRVLIITKDKRVIEIQ